MIIYNYVKAVSLPNKLFWGPGQCFEGGHNVNVHSGSANLELFRIKWNYYLSLRTVSKCCMGSALTRTLYL